MKNTLLAVAFPLMAALPWPASLAPSNVGRGLPAGFEPSGVFFDAFDRTLNVIGDEGQLARIANRNGRTEVDVIPLESPWGSDFEAVTGTSKSSQLYLGIELGNQKLPVVAEFNPIAFRGVFTGRHWQLMMPVSEKDGMEGLTLIEDGQHPWGSGMVFVASSQVDGTVYVYRPDFGLLGLGRAGFDGLVLQPIAKFKPVANRTDISDLYFSKGQKLLYVLYDEDHKLTALDLSGRVIREYDLPKGKDYEGFAFIENCPNIYSQVVLAADDKIEHPVLLFNGFPIRCP